MPYCFSILSDQVFSFLFLQLVPHLIFVLTEVGFGPIETHPIKSISLGFVFIQGLHHILNPPQLLLDADMLLAGWFCLGVHRKQTHVNKRQQQQQKKHLQTEI